MAHMTLDFKSTALTRNVSMEVFLPGGEGSPIVNPPYKTLYFLPGFSSSAVQTAAYVNFRYLSLLHGLAIVIVNGDNSFYVNQPLVMANYSDYITNELLTFTRTILPLSDKREDTFIGGISMGGFGAIINGIKASEKFSKIVALSPGVDMYAWAHRPDQKLFQAASLDRLFGSEEQYNTSYESNRYAVLNAQKEKRPIPELFISCGTEDQLVGPQVTDYLTFLKEHDVPYTYETAAGGHDVMHWATMLPKAISFLDAKPADAANN